MKYAVITGASSGLGEEFAKQLSSKYHLILVARRENRLQEISRQYQYSDYIVCDLSKEEECIQLFEQLKDKDIELFINNAGFGDCGYFIETDLNKDIQMIDTNVKALHILTKLALKHMKKGKILNVGSVAGLMPAGPYMATYYATKNYVVSLSRALAYELKEHHSDVSVHVLCPGPVDTEFNAVANVRFALPGISAKECVTYALKALSKGKTTIIPSYTIRLAALASKLAPEKVTTMITAHQQKKKIYK